MPPRTGLTVKQLHDDTGRSVRRAGAAKRPIPITDRGQLVAVLAHPSLVRTRPRQRVLVPGYEAMIARPAADQVRVALDEVRGER